MPLQNFATKTYALKIFAALRAAFFIHNQNRNNDFLHRSPPQAEIFDIPYYFRAFQKKNLRNLICKIFPNLQNLTYRIFLPKKIFAYVRMFTYYICKKNNTAVLYPRLIESGFLRMIRSQNSKSRLMACNP